MVDRIEYTIYYGDGSTFESVLTAGDPPARGVQVIVQPHPEVAVEMVTGCDYYVLDGGRWRGVDIFGLFDFLLDSGIVLFGRMIGRKEYQEVYKQAAADRKAGYLPWEVKPDA